MFRFRSVLMALAGLFVVAVPAFAATTGSLDLLAQGDTLSLASISALGAGLAVLGAALGIGRIGGSAVEGMARQPEAASQIQTAMIISAALIEGAAFFGLIVAIMKS